MKLSQRLLSAVLSCAFIGSAAFSQVVSAEEKETVTSADIHDTTTLTESKEESEETTVTEAEQTSEAISETTVTEAMEAVISAGNAAAEIPFNVFDIFAAHQGYLENLRNSANKYRRAEGIDVSVWQADIDWKQVKNDGIDFAIVRAGYGKFANQEDIRFRNNVEQAQAQGIETGAYWYSYALTVEDAQKEAEACYEVIKNYDFTYPVYFDIEDPSQQKLSTAETSAIIETFCTYIQDRGYYAGLYSYSNFLSTKVYPSVLAKYDVWVANFGVAVPAYSSEYGMWQYSSTGLVDGIDGLVDLNHAYVNYPSIVSPQTYDPAKYPNTTSEPVYPVAEVDKGIANGIDISQWQKEIDWKKVKSTGVKFAIIRAGYGKFADQKDKDFDYNMKESANAGIERGVYWYSYATTVEDAIREAETCISVIKDYKFEYPVYFDVEDEVIRKLPKSTVTAITNAFCSTIEKAGYMAGITSYSNFLNTLIDQSLYKKYAVWVAHYNVYRPAFSKHYGMWQYSSTSRIDGIEGDVDCDYLYDDYPAIIREKHLNGY